MTQLEYGFVMEDDPHFPLGADAVQLAHAAAAEIPPRARVCDLGAGAGAVSLLLAAARPDLSLHGIELRGSAAELFSRNIAANGVSDRVRVCRGDVRDVRTLFPAGSFGEAVANPPYRAVHEGRLPPDPERAAARTELCGDLRDFCRAAAYLLPRGGGFTVVYPPEKLPALFEALRDAGLAPSRLTLCHPSGSANASIAVCRAVRGGRMGLTVLPPILLAP